MSITDDIKAIGLECGFHAVGVTGVEPFLEAEASLQDRVVRKHLDQCGFDTETIQARTHPQISFPAARSIISIALSYTTSDTLEASPKSDSFGFFARFSYGIDYHTVLREKMSKFADRIRREIDNRVDIRSFADTGPFVDRSVAVRSGIGSFGKNCCVYTRDYGSWVVLGELITDLELQADPPSREICGKCSKCMEACPMGAISAPYTVDAGICLSRITQSKGYIPQALRKAMGSRIYGCDTCQSACPVNKHAIPGNIESFRPLSWQVTENPAEWLNISSTDFQQNVAPATAGWIRRQRFRRNVAVALGNMKDTTSVPQLIEAVSDPDPIIRSHSAWALGRIGGHRAGIALGKALVAELDSEVLSEIRYALDMIG